MDVADQDPPHRRLPTLVQLCQRAAVANIDAIYSLGDTLAYPLVKPVLEECSPEQLVRFEQLSPHLRKDTPEIWKDLCFRKYRLTAVERYSFDDDPQEPDSWKSRYFTLQDAEAKRIEEVGSRIRSQRREADERKKEKEVKYTDRVPPPKRPRMGAWNTTIQPKSLFQKTKSEASKVQRALNARVLPPMPSTRGYRVQSLTPSPALPPAPPSSTSRVTVHTVIHRRSAADPSSHTSSSTIRPSPLSASRPPKSSPPPPTECLQKSIPPRHILPSTAAAVSITDPPGPRVNPKSSSVKKDPMASLFVPTRKLKAYSQRPV